MNATLGSKDDRCNQRKVLGPAIDGRRMYVLFSLLCSLAILIWRHSLLQTLSVALKVDAYTHILLIVPISLLLLGFVLRRQPWKPVPAVLLGIALLSSSLLIGVAALGLQSAGGISVGLHLSCEMLAFVIWLIGSFVLCFGRDSARACLFPLLFLAWLVPLPDIALSYVIHFLQQGTAFIAYAMLGAVGAPVIKNGTDLSLPGLTLQIVEECSSIRSSMMLIVSSMVMAYVLLRSYWARGIVMLAAIPLAIFKNGLRVLTLALLGAYVNPEILDSPLHHQGGVLFFAVSLLGMFALIWLMEKAERRALKIATSQVDLPAPASSLS